MFGVLKPPKTCCLPPEDRDAWRRSYCGGCKALGEQASFGARFTLSYDQTFFALLIEGLQEHESSQGECRCPASPWLKRPINDPQSPALKRATLLHMMLVDQWIYDQQLDQSPRGFFSSLYQKLWGGARVWSQSELKGCLKDAYDSGILLSPYLLKKITSFSQHQRALEQQHENTRLTLSLAAQPTRELLGLAFEELTVPVLPEQHQTKQVKKSLKRLGRLIGWYVYLTDVLQDLQDDLSKGDFNPCIIKSYGAWVVCESTVSEALSEIAHSKVSIEQLLLELPFYRHQELLIRCFESPLKFKLPHELSVYQREANRVLFERRGVVRGEHNDLVIKAKTQDHKEQAKKIADKKAKDVKKKTKKKTKKKAKKITHKAQEAQNDELQKEEPQNKKTSSGGTPSQSSSCSCCEECCCDIPCERSGCCDKLCSGKGSCCDDCCQPGGGVGCCDGGDCCTC